MSAVTGVLGIVGTGLLLLAVLVRKEIGPLCSWLAPKLARRSAARLPAEQREIREEEWLAHLNSMEGMEIFRLVAASGFWIGAVRISRMPSVRAALTTERMRKPGPNGYYGMDVSLIQMKLTIEDGKLIGMEPEEVLEGDLDLSTYKVTDFMFDTMRKNIDWEAYAQSQEWTDDDSEVGAS